MFVLRRDNDGALLQASFLNNVPHVTAILANSATDAFAGIDNGSFDAAHFLQFQLGEHSFRWWWIHRDRDRAHLDGSVSCLLAFLKTKVAILPSVGTVRQACVGVDLCQADVHCAFDFECQRLNRSCRTHLRAEVAVLVTPGMFWPDDWSPQCFETVFPSGGVQYGTGTDFETLSAANAQVQKSTLWHAAGRADWPSVCSMAMVAFPVAERGERGAHASTNDKSTS